jgi:hypothetical protein
MQNSNKTLTSTLCPQQPKLPVYLFSLTWTEFAATPNGPDKKEANPMKYVGKRQKSMLDPIHVLST